MSQVKSAHDESPVFFRAGSDDLFGILTRPTGEPNGAAVLMLWGAGAYPSSGRNQIRTRLARRFATSGYHTFRIDYRGIGESSGEPSDIYLDRPFTTDALAAVEWLEDHGLSRIVLLANCFGTRTALASTDRISGLAGVALIGAPVRDENHLQKAAPAKSMSWYLKRMLRPAVIRGLAHETTRDTYARWAKTKLKSLRTAGPPHASKDTAGALVSPGYLVPVCQVLGRSVPLLVVYGDRDPFYRDFDQARAGRLGDVLTQAGILARVEVVSTIGAPINLFASVELQEELLDVVDGWLDWLSEP